MLAFLQRFANAFELGTCWSCGYSKVAAASLCPYCEEALPRWYPRCCQHLSDIEQHLVAEQKPCRYWYGALRWEPQVQQLITQFKFRYKAELAPLLANQLAAHLRLCYREEPLPDCVVAVPMTQQAWRKRGFHQTALLARHVSVALELPYIAGGLRKIRAVPMQHMASKALRWENSRGSQLALQDFSGCTVAVVDDVLSTGATMMAAADALYKKGARAVDAWAVVYNQHD
ncbi:ComF family protein [Idiomarina loihiensis]|jgi:ComF family protein|uniref:Competence protein n=1 Tax=Idiomarina loihiensis (strain ATCC BAA-735 / DSM 15497 / L2-TR) TaxID=283942 RepID=Q5QZB9_IDILO|nr:phosphoribosyltransferase family protein [Idiomarina loihiensis]AAV81090.1 Competence protein [Idiomarina loihiensis L2TR]AGM35114.1 competence protein [Idiomarina loihiensis GSL 199]PHQ92966.1 MAG: competence protein [Idiomarina sp.]